MYQSREISANSTAFEQNPKDFIINAGIFSTVLFGDDADEDIDGDDDDTAVMMMAIVLGGLLAPLSQCVSRLLSSNIAAAATSSYCLPLLLNTSYCSKCSNYLLILYLVQI